jgi:sigma-B regulation protein RsbU (phosphoserine phosphatase)
MLMVTEEIKSGIERRYAAVAQDLRQELTLAAEMQLHLLPRTSPLKARLDLAARSIPARAVGGDFYEFIRYGAKRTSAGAIGDATGKGIAAAIYAAMVTGMVRALAQQEPGAAEMLSALNAMLLGRPVQARFVSLIYATWDERARRLQIANSGLPHPIHVHNGRITSVEADGLPLGIFHDAEYQEVSLSCAPGDMVVCFTDGITDAQDANDQEFGRSRLEEVVALHANGSAQEVVNAIFDAVATHSHGAEAFDDQSLIVIRT